MKILWKEWLLKIGFIIGILLAISGLFYSTCLKHKEYQEMKSQIKQNGKELDKVDKQVEQLVTKLKKLIELEEKNVNEQSTNP